MTKKRFRHMRNRLGMQFIGYDEKYVLLGTFADADGVKYIVDLLNQLSKENEELQTKNNAYIQDVEAYREENTHLKLDNEKLKHEIEDLNDILARYEEKELQKE